MTKIVVIGKKKTLTFNSCNEAISFLGCTQGKMVYLLKTGNEVIGQDGNKYFVDYLFETKETEDK